MSRSHGIGTCSSIYLLAHVLVGEPASISPEHALAERAANTPQFFTMLAAASGGRMVTNPGGVLIRDADGDIIGAVGISGDTSDKDEVCAVAGVEAAGLKADPGGEKK